MSHRSPVPDPSARREVPSCLLSIVLGTALLLTGFFAVYCLGLGQHPRKFVHQVLIVAFAITAHLTAERCVLRLARLRELPQVATPVRRVGYCLLSILLTFALLLAAFFAVFVLGLGHDPNEYVHEVMIAGFAITAHLAVERWVRRLGRLWYSRFVAPPPADTPSS